MIAWREQRVAIRDAFWKFHRAEIVPVRDQLGHRRLVALRHLAPDVRDLLSTIERSALGRPASLAEASAGKLYAARTAMQVALEAVQLHGGNGYMAEFRVEQLCRDAKVLQIYAGTDEIQISQIARSLLGRS